MKIIRARVKEQYKIEPYTYVIATVKDNRVVRLASQHETWDTIPDINENGAKLMLYQLPEFSKADRA